jgi:hypothetical protein
MASADEVLTALEACVGKSSDDKKDALRALTVRRGPRSARGDLAAPRARAAGAARARAPPARAAPRVPRPRPAARPPAQALIDPTDESYEVQKDAAGAWSRRRGGVLRRASGAGGGQGRREARAVLRT